MWRDSEKAPHASARARFYPFILLNTRAD